MIDSRLAEALREALNADDAWSAAPPGSRRATVARRDAMLADLKLASVARAVLWREVTE